MGKYSGVVRINATDEELFTPVAVSEWTHDQDNLA
jgi:hypothetical protein